MSFLAPWFLVLGGAAAVPLLIHLLRRRIALRLEFPAARYLARAEREHSRTMRMRNLLLMLLRILAVLVLAAAAARPRAAVAGTGHAPTAFAIVLDNSMSAAVVERGAPLLDQLKQRARDVLSLASADDRAWLITADGASRGGSIAALSEELDRIRPYAGAGRMREAVARAMATVQAAGFEARQVMILTDGQRSTWSDPAPNRNDVPVMIWTVTSRPPTNRAVVMAEARPQRWTPRGAIAARVSSVDSATYRMTLGDRTLARGTVAPNEEAVVRASPPERGWVRGTVEIEPDELPGDNVRYFAVWLGPSPNVRVAPGAGPFARNAIDVLRASERVTAAGGPAISVSPADEASALPALLVPPTDAVRLGAANRALERLGVPWRFGALRRETAIARGQGEQQLPAITVSWRYELLPQGARGGDSDVLARVGTSPWIVAGDGYVLLGSPLIPDASRFPVSAAFLPWLSDVISARLHGDRGEVRLAAPGERIPAPAAANALEGPSGSRTSLSGSQFDAPATPGTYFYIEGTNRAGALVVNAEPSESRLERWPANEIRDHVVSSGGHTVSEANEWKRVAFQSGAGRPLVVPLLVLAFLALTAEGIVASGAHRQR